MLSVVLALLLERTQTERAVTVVMVWYGRL